MGAGIGRVWSTVWRPFRNYNVRERAHSLMESEIPKAAPRHPTEERIAKLQAAERLPIEEFSRKDDTLLNKLKDVYVTSTESKLPEPPESRKSRPLPTKKGSVPMDEMGYPEPRYVPEGKITLRNAVTMITDYSADPQTYTIDSLAATYKLPREDVESIVNNFSAFQIYTPPDQASTFTKWFIPSWLRDKPPVQIESK